MHSTSSPVSTGMLPKCAISTHSNSPLSLERFPLLIQWECPHFSNSVICTGLLPLLNSSFSPSRTCKVLGAATWVFQGCVSLQCIRPLRPSYWEHHHEFVCVCVCVCVRARLCTFTKILIQNSKKVSIALPLKELLYRLTPNCEPRPPTPSSSFRTTS